METALGWLGDVFRFLLSLVPRLLIVRSTHRAVKFARGKNPYVLRPGLHFYWPLVTEVEVVPVTWQTVDLVPQYLTTADGFSVAVSGIVVYEVDDVLKLLTECFDYDAMIRSYSLAAIKRVIAVNTFAFLQAGGAETDRLLTGELRRLLRRYGVRTIRVTLSDFTRCFVLGSLSGTVSAVKPSTNFCG